MKPLDAEVQHVVDLQDLSERVETAWRELHPRKLYTRPPKPQPKPRRALDFDSLPSNPTIKDLSALWGITVGAIHKKIARGQLPKPIRRNNGELYRWRREDIIIRFGPRTK